MRVLFSWAVLLLAWIQGVWGSHRPSRQKALGLVSVDQPFPQIPGRRQRIPGLYKRRYSEITWMGTHNSEALRKKENGWTLSGNQYFNLTVQLDSGIRLIQAQGHPDINGTNEIRLCHFNCALLDGGSLEEYLLIAKDWLERNPEECQYLSEPCQSATAILTVCVHQVVTFLFVNAGVTLEQWADAFSKTGFEAISYVPPMRKRHGRMQIEDWPSVEEMVQSGKRAVTFLSRGADEYYVPYLLPEFEYMFETAFSNYEPVPAFSCSPSRPYFPPTNPVPNRLTLVNHFLYGRVFGFPYPFAKEANHTNGPGFSPGELGEHATRCRTQYERRPNFFLLDFFNEGDIWAVEHGLNAH